MKALCYHQPGSISFDEIAEPSIVADTDAIVRVTTATICGTDLHIWQGDVPEVESGRVLGHEAVGVVEQVGPGVKRVRPGDRVLLSCISSCATCPYCRQGRLGLCTGGGGWILGHLVDGTQAEMVRVPFADTSTYPLSNDVTDEAAVMLADLLPTAYEVGVLNGRVAPGSSVAVVGSGPIGLGAITCARLFSPDLIIAIDVAESRLQAAKLFGADAVINDGTVDPVAAVLTATDGDGVDVAIEAVGVPATFELATRIVKAGGQVANIGVHGKPATLHLEDLWPKDLTITTGLVDTRTTATLLKLVRAGTIDAGQFITHRFSFDEALEAYDVFRRAGETNALKVVLAR